MRKTKIDRLREETYNDMLNLLETYKRCALIRPTGFGKTGLLTKLIKSGLYSRILFLYPAEVVKNTVLNFYYGGTSETEIPCVEFMTYSKLINLSSEDMDSFSDVDLIICDECHRLGAPKTYRAIQLMLSSIKGVALLGATATPNRMDLVDVIGDFFDNRVVFQYTLHDAFKDKILHKPYYCYCTYGVSDITEVERKARLEIEKTSDGRDVAEKLLRSRLIEISNLQRMDKIIKDTCEKFCSDVSYMKFIVFFTSISHMNEKGADVKKWFKSAFPSHKQHIVKVSSETAESASNVRQLDNMVRREGTIDLIFCVEMMNMGYHVDDITGIVMYRGTESGIIFNQQLGRALSSGANSACIVFDVVDNIHREAVYSVLGMQPQKVKMRKRRYEALLAKSESGVSLTEDEASELHALEKSFAKDYDKWWVSCNDLQPTDLIATGHEATYRELIAKTLAEPISMRCRQAWKRWKEKGGSDNPFTREHVLEQKSPDAVPLSPFCELKNVSVNAVLKEMGL